MKDIKTHYRDTDIRKSKGIGEQEATGENLSKGSHLKVLREGRDRQPHEGDGRSELVAEWSVFSG